MEADTRSKLASFGGLNDSLLFATLAAGNTLMLRSTPTGSREWLQVLSAAEVRRRKETEGRRAVRRAEGEIENGGIEGCSRTESSYGG